MTTRHRALAALSGLTVVGSALAATSAIAPAANAAPPWRSAFVLGYAPTAASYTAVGPTSWNGAGAANTIVRTGVGRYDVKFGGIAGGNGGTVAVSAYGGSPGYCKTVNWGPSGSSVIARIACWKPNGTPVDTKFEALYTTGVGSANRYAFAFANLPASPAYTPDPSRQFNNTGAGPTTITRPGLGTYLVRIPGMSTAAGTVKITAVGNDSKACKVNSWGGSPLIVRVTCTTMAGAAADAAFTVQYTERTNDLGVNILKPAYAWGNLPLAASYTPATPYQYNGQTLAPTNTINRLGVGRYEFKHGMAPGITGGHVQVTAYGPGAARCQVLQWNQGAAQLQCFTANGAPVDTQFTVQYAT